MNTDVELYENTVPTVPEAELVALAWRRYLDTDLSLVELAVELSMDVSKLVKWAKNGDWSVRKKAFIEEAMDRERQESLQFRNQNRRSMTRKECETLQKTQGIVRKLLEDHEKGAAPLSVLDLSRLVEMHGSLVDQRVKVVGEFVDKEEVEAQAAGKAPLVCLNIGGSVTVAKKHDGAVSVLPESEDDNERHSGTDNAVKLGGQAEDVHPKAEGAAGRDCAGVGPHGPASGSGTSAAETPVAG